MASSLQRMRHSLSANSYRLAISPFLRAFSTDDSLVEIKPGEIGVVSGIPEEHLRRKVLIFSPARTATQQGSGKLGRWKINFLSTQKWENPLMGWTSTGDPYSHVGDSALSFESQEAAIAFAERHGWEYTYYPRKRVISSTYCYFGIVGMYWFECGKIGEKIPVTKGSVKKRQTPLLKVKTYADNFKWKGPPKTDAN